MEPDLQTADANIEPGHAYLKDAPLTPAAVEALNHRSLAELEELNAKATNPIGEAGTDRRVCAVDLQTQLPASRRNDFLPLVYRVDNSPRLLCDTDA